MDLDGRPNAEHLDADDGVVVMPQDAENQAVDFPASTGALLPGEMAEAMSLPASRRSSVVVPETPGSGTAAPGTPVQSLLCRVPRSSLQNRGFQQTLSRARSLDDSVAEDGNRGFKRSASGPAEELDREPPTAPFSSIPEGPGYQPALQPSHLPEESQQPPEGAVQSSLDQPSLQPAHLHEESQQPLEGALEQTSTSRPRQPFEAWVLTQEQLDSLGSDDLSHPLLRVQVQAQAELDRRFPLDSLEYDLGTWDGRWSLLCERDWQLRESLGLPLPVGVENEALGRLRHRRQGVSLPTASFRPSTALSLTRLPLPVGRLTWTTTRWKYCRWRRAQRCERSWRGRANWIES